MPLQRSQRLFPVAAIQSIVFLSLGVFRKSSLPSAKGGGGGGDDILCFWATVLLTNETATPCYSYSTDS